VDDGAVGKDFVIATGGETHSDREFVEESFKFIGKKIEWRGSDVDKVGVEAGTEVVRVKVNPKYFRPTEVDLLLGDATKAKTILGWTPKCNFIELVKDMMEADMELMKKNPRA